MQVRHNESWRLLDVYVEAGRERGWYDCSLHKTSIG